MLLSDKKSFGLEMANCFQNYSKQVTPEVIDYWFDELRGFNSFHVTQAFRHHVREYEKFAPTLAQIIKSCKVCAKNEFAKGRDERAGKCFVKYCNTEPNERFSAEVIMCRKHADDYYLKTQPDSIQAEMVRRSRKFEEEAKAKGMSNLEYFKFCNPPGKSIFADAALKNFRAEKTPAEVSAAVDKKIEQDRIIASHHENMVPEGEKGVDFGEIDFVGYEEMFK